MKRYKVRICNYVRHLWDEYEVNAEDPVDARHPKKRDENESNLVRESKR